MAEAAEVVRPSPQELCSSTRRQGLYFGSAQRRGVPAVERRPALLHTAATGHNLAESALALTAGGIEEGLVGLVVTLRNHRQNHSCKALCDISDMSCTADAGEKQTQREEERSASGQHRTHADQASE